MCYWSMGRREGEYAWKTFEDIMARFFPNLIINIHYPLTDPKNPQLGWKSNQKEIQEVSSRKKTHPIQGNNDTDDGLFLIWNRRSQSNRKISSKLEK